MIVTFTILFLKSFGFGCVIDALRWRSVTSLTNGLGFSGRFLFLLFLFRLCGHGWFFVWGCRLASVDDRHLFLVQCFHTLVVRFKHIIWTLSIMSQSLPPPELLKSHHKMFDAIFNFCVVSKRLNFPPERALSSLITCFFSVLKMSPERRRNLLVAANNLALRTMDETD